MKKCLFVLAAVACCACSKGVAESSVMMDEVVELRFSVPVAATKASGNVTEDAVESLQVFVFGEDGQIQASGQAFENSLTLTCTAGEKTIAAVVNASELEGVTTLNGLKQKLSDFSDNSLEKFVMSGVITQELLASGEIVIPVKRLVSKVTISSVVRAFRLEQHKAMDFELMSVFVTGVPQQVGFFSTAQSAELINEGVTDMNTLISDSGDLLYDELGEIPVQQDATVEVGNFLYPYPNGLTDASRPAYLVLQTRLGDGVYYYSVELPEMESNKCYDVSLTVTMPGSLTPNVPVQKEEAVFSVSVMDWSGKVNVDETI